jgi:hypothetical protein
MADLISVKMTNKDTTNFLIYFILYIKIFS